MGWKLFEIFVEAVVPPADGSAFAESVENRKRPAMNRKRQVFVFIGEREIDEF